MINLILPMMFACSAIHTPARVHYSDIRGIDEVWIDEPFLREVRQNSIFASEVKPEALIYSKKINFWVDGKWVGHGKNRHYVAGHWEKRVVVPPSDRGYIWVPGHYTRKPSKDGRARGWESGHWEKR